MLASAPIPPNDLGLLVRRDISNFTAIRTAHAGDDHQIGELLVRAFRDTYAYKMPDLVTTSEREAELRDVRARRANGLVRVMEIGFRVIGTYSLLSPESPSNEAWTPRTSTLRCLAVDPEFHALRLSEILLMDAQARAQEWACASMCLHVQDGAHGVAKLYERFGFLRDVTGDKICQGNRILGYLKPL